MLARDRIRDAYWRAVAIPPAWALGWLVSSYVITTNVKEQFAVFGGSGALVFGLLTRPLPLHSSSDGPHPIPGERRSLRFADLGRVAVYCTECDEREFGEPAG